MDSAAIPLPMPRLQFRWRKPNRREAKKAILGSGPDWVCDYELILPLGEYDMRRKGGRDYLALKLGGTRVKTTAREMTDTPFRDGAHASWDSKALGGMPVVVIGSDGVVRLRTESDDGWHFSPFEKPEVTGKQQCGF